jgi:hypothetical protein
MNCHQPLKLIDAAPPRRKAQLRMADVVGGLPIRAGIH